MAGYDCSYCDFGFIATAAGECVKRNTSQLLELAKTEEEEEWAALDSNSTFTMQNVSTYDMLVFVHVLTR